ncbi:MAG: thiamine-phosphate kinase [Deltaproteobacteria bacterium]|nr:thiamine-phosphate kinase [Deltaproteobacteria bacterium]
MREFELIEQIRQTVGKPSKRVLMGIGDDCAVLHSPKARLLATTDCLVEGVHFDFSYMSAFEVGFKALAVNLSDIAAMGGKPLYALVTIGLGKGAEQSVRELYRGMSKIARDFSVDIVGGNVSRSPRQTFVDVSLIGQAGLHTHFRKGAKKNDLIAVTGHLGASAVGLRLLKTMGRVALSRYPTVSRAHLMPSPRVIEGNALGRLSGVTSLIDISDGLAADLQHILAASNVGALIEQDALPIHLQTEKACSELDGCTALECALYGGEDYELLMTIAPKYLAEVKRAVPKVKIIGQVLSASQGCVLRRANRVVQQLGLRGWDHLSP